MLRIRSRAHLELVQISHALCEYGSKSTSCRVEPV